MGVIITGEENLINMLGNVGVPAAVCFYTLFRVNQTLRDLTDAINKLTNDFDRRFEKQGDEIKELRLEVKALQKRE